MRRHSESVVRPLLGALRARVLVEVGVSFGATTTRLLEWAAAHNGVMHGIDPAPKPALDLDELKARYGDRFVFHRALSLDALPKIRDPDFVVIDGDHNWYTVHGELQVLARIASEEGRPYPLTVLHDVDWPYGRRDMYHDPETVPAEHRQAHTRGGMLPGVVELSGDQGINVGLENALVEGTPRNGVRTAVEDFLAQTDLKLQWTSVPGFFGVGILADEVLMERTPALREAIDVFHSPEFLEQQCRALELSRVNTMARLQEAQRTLREMRRPANERSDGAPPAEAT
jgi:Methyltransferase domain